MIPEKIIYIPRSYLFNPIWADSSSTVITPEIWQALISEKGTFDYHTHPYDNDLIPSLADRKIMRVLEQLTGQKESRIITPNGKYALFDRNGILETGIITRKMDRNLQKMLESLFGGNMYDF